jgi:hypothetical protein
VTAISPQTAIDYALEHSFERASAVSEKRLKAEALRYGVGSVLPEAVADIGDQRGVIAKDAKGQRMTTTQKALDAEVAMLQFAVDGTGAMRRLLAKLMGLTDFPKNSERPHCMSSGAGIA